MYIFSIFSIGDSSKRCDVMSFPVLISFIIMRDRLRGKTQRHNRVNAGIRRR